jgi:hypothetical protein
MRRSVRDSASTRLSALLTFWSVLGFAGCVEVFYFGLTDDWMGFLIGLTYTLAAIFMLGSGLWMRWPRA